VNYRDNAGVLGVAQYDIVVVVDIENTVKGPIHCDWHGMFLTR
jgi:hypothetical protein